MVITINISEEQIERAEKLAKHWRMTTGGTASRSSEIGRAIDDRFEAIFIRPINKTDDQPVEQAA